MSRPLGRMGLYVALVLGSLAPDAFADDSTATASPPTTPESRKEAARKFDEGTHAFDAGDFTRAGEAFEAAYLLAPHEDSLWNAARAWERAGETARAANLYARYLREAPATANDRASATTSLAQLSMRLGRLDVHLATGMERPDVDGVPTNATLVFVVPGAHVVHARSSQGDVESRQTVAAGARVSVLLANDAKPAKATETNPKPAPRDDISPPATSKGWSPIVAVVEGGVTLIVSGIAVWSGIDTLSTLNTYNATPSQAALDSGRSQEVRTNVLIGVAIGCAAITAVTAIGFIDWGKHSKSVSVSVGAGSAAIYGRF